MAQQVFKGTAKSDSMSFKSSLYDNTAIYGLGGADTIRLNDVFDAKVYGGAGADILQSVFGYNNLLQGGVGQDLYFSKGDSKLKITDTQGASGVNLNGVDNARVTLGNYDDVVNDTGGHGNVFKMGGGRDEVTLTNSAGGNKVTFANDGGMSDTITFDLSMIGMQEKGVFIGSNKPDTVVAGDGGLDIYIQAPYAWSNVSGRVEINADNFNSASDGIWFNQGPAPNFVAVEGGDVMATWLGQDGTSIFQVAVHGAGWGFPDGVVGGNNFYGGPTVFQPDNGMNGSGLFGGAGDGNAENNGFG